MERHPSHGERQEPSNRIDRDAVRAAIAAGQGEEVALPIGLQMVFEVLSRLPCPYRSRRGASGDCRGPGEEVALPIGSHLVFEG